LAVLPVRIDKKPAMFINSLKIAWRNLFRNRLHSLVNIGGLIIGFTIGILVLLTVYDQLSFDSFHENKAQLYQAYQSIYRKNATDINPQFGFPAAPVYKEAASVKRSTAFLNGGRMVQYNDRELDIPVMLVDEDFLSMFRFPIIKGNKATPLHQLTDVVITEETAKKIFGNEDPIGKTIKVATGDLQALVVSAVVKDIPHASSVRFDLLARIENRPDYTQNKDNWDSQHHPVFIELKEGATQQQAEREFREINKRYLAKWDPDLLRDGAKRNKYGELFSTNLMPFSKLHFEPRVSQKAIDKAAIYTVLTVGLLIILIACFNFVNINLATAFTRSKEIGVRKCLGAGKFRLFSQLWTESFLICCISFLVSLVLVQILLQSITIFSKMGLSLMSVLWKPDFALLAIAILLFVSLIAGGYPSWLMAKFEVVETLKGKLNLKRKSILRSSLIVMQFVIACIMISCTYIIYSQFQYLQNADLGINKESIISIPFYKPEKGWETIDKLRSRLASNPDILTITGSNINIGRGRDGSISKSTLGFDYNGKTIRTNMATIDYDYFKTFGLKLQGREFDKSYGTDTFNNVIISESMAKQFSEKQLLGKSIIVDSTSPRWNIIGIFPDFHLYSLREEMEPLTLFINRKDAINYCFIKTNSHHLKATMELLKKEMADLEPGREFRGSFLDENINNWYDQEKMLSLLFSIAAIIAILLSSMGLLAMVLLIIQQRVKEIGVRKVLGASVQHISLIISKDFLMLVFIAILISTPISWIAMNKWLQDFPYRIEIRWWMFVLIAIAALLIAMLTISFNTIRAARQNPIKSLRTE
jgi:putative ABC transport system permease protein